MDLSPEDLSERDKRALMLVDDAGGFGHVVVKEAIRRGDDAVSAFYAHAEETGADREPWLEDI